MKRKHPARVRGSVDPRVLLDAAPDAILAVDADGRIVVVNQQAGRLFGYKPDELLGEQVELLIPDSVREVHRGHTAQYLADPRPRPMGSGLQLAGRRRDGTEFPVEISLGALGRPGGVMVVAAVRDITERLRAQEERAQLQRIAERERYERLLHQSQRLESLGQLAGGVAHDFNNLLGVILIYAGLVAEEVGAASAIPGGEHWGSVRADVARIEQAAQRAAELTRQLLAFGRRDGVQPRVMSINTTVVDLREMLTRTLGAHVEVVTDLAADLWPVVVDPGQLEQVLLNLALNGRDAMPRGGTLAVETANIEADEHLAGTLPGITPGRYVLLRVRDTGAGMDRATAAHAFDPLFTTKPRGEGSGLGLATVFSIITQAGGVAQISSEPGVGTTFNAYLPAGELDLAGEERRPDEPALQSRGAAGEGQGAT